MKIFILIITFFYTQFINADQNPWDEANKIIEQTKQAARKDAESLVEVDVLSAIEQVITEFPKVSDFNKEFNNLITSNENLKNMFLKVSQKNATEIAEDREKVIKVYDDYKKAVRIRFKNSFKSAEMNFELNKLVNMIQSASRELERKCTYGRALSSHNYKSVKLQVPKLEYQLMVKYSTGLDGNFDPANISYDYQIQTAAESKSLEDVNKLNNALLTANGLVVSTAYSTNTATALNAALVNGAGAVMPYTIAISLVASIATTIAAKKEQARLETEVSDAQQHIFYNTADSSDVIKYYKKHCKNVVESFYSVADTIDKLIKNKVLRKDLLAQAGSTRNERKSWQTDSTKNKKFQDNLVLLNYYKNKKCLKKNSVEYNIEKEKGNTFCYYSNSKIGFQNTNAEFDFDITKLNSKILELKSKINTFGKTYPIDKTTIYLTHQLVELFSPRLTIVENGFNKIAFDLIDKLQERAFQKLIQILTYYRQYKLKHDVVFQELNGQLDIYRSISKIKTDLDNIVALSISEIFSDVGSKELKENYDKLVNDFQPIKNNYMYLNSVGYLDYSISNLESYISSL